MPIERAGSWLTFAEMLSKRIGNTCGQLNQMMGLPHIGKLQTVKDPVLKRFIRGVKQLVGGQFDGIVEGFDHPPAIITGLTLILYSANILNIHLQDCIRVASAHVIVRRNENVPRQISRSRFTKATYDASRTVIETVKIKDKDKRCAGEQRVNPHFRVDGTMGTLMRNSGETGRDNADGTTGFIVDLSRRSKLPDKLISSLMDVLVQEQLVDVTEGKEENTSMFYPLKIRGHIVLMVTRSCEFLKHRKELNSKHSQSMKKLRRLLCTDLCNGTVLVVIPSDGMVLLDGMGIVMNCIIKLMPHVVKTRCSHPTGRRGNILRGRRRKDHHQTVNLGVGETIAIYATNMSILNDHKLRLIRTATVNLSDRLCKNSPALTPQVNFFFRTGDLSMTPMVRFQYTGLKVFFQFENSFVVGGSNSELCHQFSLWVNAKIPSCPLYAHTILFAFSSFFKRNV